MNFVVEALGERHDRSFFASGNGTLNHYLKSQATQDVRRRMSACYVATTAESDSVAGYYTLSAASIALDDLPPEWAKRLPRYPTVPAVRIGRLAADRRYHGQGLGGLLLADALDRAIRSEIVCHAAIVDAKDDDALGFYRHHGFLSFAGEPRTLFLPLVRIRGLTGR